MFIHANVKRFLYSFVSTLGLISIALSACNLPAASTPTPNDPNLIYTAAAQTVSAELTRSAGELPATATPQKVEPTATQQTFPTEPEPPAPTKTPLPSTATGVPTPCDRATFVKDVTIPDGTKMSPGTEFVKTWRLKNNGTCTWNSSYDLVFYDKKALGGPAVQQLSTGTIQPGETIDVSVKLKAPSTAGNYESDWMLRNGSDVIFGIGQNADDYFWVKITVVNSVNYDFLAKAKDAEWSNATETIPFGDPNDDSPGVAAYGENVKLEDGKTYPKILGTFPERIEDGMIKGVFSPYTVQASDRFRATVGFRSSCENGQVKFQFGFLEGGDFRILKEWSKSCDGKIKELDYDLSGLEGEEHEFILAVDADGPFKNDKAVWIDPRIEEINPGKVF